MTYLREMPIALTSLPCMERSGWRSALLNVSTHIRHFHVTMNPFSSTEREEPRASAAMSKGQKLRRK